jgi:hypothetical protein
MSNIKTFEGFFDYIKGLKDDFVNDRKISKLKREISNRCIGLRISNFSINDDGSINVTGDLRISDSFYDRDLEPLHFKKVDGNVTVGSFYRLSEIPVIVDEVTGDWNCYNTRLDNLKGSPREVGGSYYCRRNNVRTLEGAPVHVGGNFDVSNNMIDSLVGSPRFIGGRFDIGDNRLTSFEGAPKYIGDYFDISNNRISSFDHLPEDCNLRFDDNPIYYIWSLFRYKAYGKVHEFIDLFKAYDPIHPTTYRSYYGKNSILYLNRLKLFLEEVLKITIENITEYLKNEEIRYGKRRGLPPYQGEITKASLYSVIQEFYYIR